MGKVVRNYFGGSVKQVMSFFVKQENVSVKELEEMLNLIRKDENEEKDPS